MRARANPWALCKFCVDQLSLGLPQAAFWGWRREMEETFEGSIFWRDHSTSKQSWVLWKHQTQAMPKMYILAIVSLTGPASLINVSNIYANSLAMLMSVYLNPSWNWRAYGYTFWYENIWIMPILNPAASFSFFESVTPSTEKSLSSIPSASTAAATTGPASGPRPASQISAGRWRKSEKNGCSTSSTIQVLLFYNVLQWVGPFFGTP